jgi:signal transduction histidine kinase
MLGVERAIYAPLKVGEESLGLMVVIGASLSEVDIPAVTVFVNQAAIALENAQLFEKVHAGRERLKVLSRQLVDAQETVRRRVARELHDQIGQILTGLSLLLGVSEQAPVDLLGSRLREAQDLVEELMSRVDQMSLDLRPAMLDDLGLLHALVWHIERYSSHTGVKVALEHSGMDRRFPSQVETAAYRIVQEGLTNVARHSSASKATVRLWCDEGTLHVQVDDQGVGFDLTMASEAGGLGGMKERSALLGGKMAVESIPGEGTRVTAELPIDGVEGEEG